MREKRKFVRLSLAPFESGTVSFHPETHPMRRRIHNISYRGLGAFAHEGDHNRLVLGANMPISLDIEGIEINLNGAVTFVNDAFIGVSYRTLDNEMRTKLSLFIDPRILGAELKEIPQAQLQDKSQRFFVGPNNTRLLISTARGSSGVTECVEVLYLNHYVRVDANDRIATASLTAQVPDSGVSLLHETDEFLDFDARINKRRIEEVKTMLQYAPLEKDLQEKLAWRLRPRARSRSSRS